MASTPNMSVTSSPRAGRPYLIPKSERTNRAVASVRKHACSYGRCRRDG